MCFDFYIIILSLIVRRFVHQNKTEKNSKNVRVFVARRDLVVIASVGITKTSKEKENFEWRVHGSIHSSQRWWRNSLTRIRGIMRKLSQRAREDLSISLEIGEKKETVVMHAFFATAVLNFFFKSFFILIMVKFSQVYHLKEFLKIVNSCVYGISVSKVNSESEHRWELVRNGRTERSSNRWKKRSLPSIRTPNITSLSV